MQYWIPSIVFPEKTPHPALWANILSVAKAVYKNKD
jgi:hypothetical protein